MNTALAEAVDAISTRWFGDARPHHRRVTALAVLDLPAVAIRAALATRDS